MTTDYN